MASKIQGYFEINNDKHKDLPLSLLEESEDIMLVLNYRYIVLYCKNQKNEYRYRTILQLSCIQRKLIEGDVVLQEKTKKM